MKHGHTHPGQNVRDDAGVALLGLGHEPPFVAAVETLWRIIESSVLVACFSTISALNIAADFDLANVEGGTIIWQPQEVENLRALGLGVIIQETAAGACR
jgi:hypothetical protein